MGRRWRARHGGAGVLLIWLLAASCEEPLTRGPDAVAVSVLLVGPDTTVAVQQTLSLTAVAQGPEGAPIAGAAIAWTSNDPAVATIDDRGTVTGIAPGTVTVTGRTGQASGSLELTVRGFLVGPGGGAARSADGRATLDIPPGALDENVVIAVVPATPGQLGDLDREGLVTGSAYDFAPDGQTFLTDVEMTIEYDPAGLPAGVEESALRLSRAEGGSWARLPGGTLDRRGRKVKGKTRRFSLYAAVASDGDGGGSLPSAAIVAPADGSTFTGLALVDFAGAGVDAEDGDLTGASLVWTSDLDGQIGTGAGFSTSGLSIGTHAITLTATDSDGGTATDQIAVTIENNPPVATITSPSDGDSFLVGLAVGLEGTAVDPEDGTLSGDALEWSSSLEGILGTGIELDLGLLSIGTHTITLTATDSMGATGTDRITVIILLFE